MSHKEESISVERLNKLFCYDPKTGILTNKIKRSSRAIKGAISGKVNDQGYLCVCVDRVCVRVHRLVFAMYYGKWPKQQIDHSNGNRSDNRIENLREATHSQNLQNTKKRENNTSGVHGVHWSKRAKKWQVQIEHQRKRIYIGIFENLTDATFARKEAEKKYHAEYSHHKCRSKNENSL